MNGFADSMLPEWIRNTFRYLAFFAFLGVFNIGSLVVCYLLGLGVLKPLLISIGFTVAFIIICAYAQNTYLAVFSKRIEHENIKAFSQQAAVVHCAFCEEENFIPIRLDETESKFTCEHCGKQNALFVEIFAAQTAVPLEIQHDSLLRYTDNREEQYAAALAKHREELNNESNANKDT
jgi:hypothetical protein